MRNLTKETKSNIRDGGGSPKSNFGGISNSMIHLRKHAKGSTKELRHSANKKSGLIASRTPKA